MEQEQGSWQYKPPGATAVAEPPPAPAAAPPAAPPAQPPKGGSVSWTASEYIDHDRGADWYLMLAGGTLVLAGLVYLISRDIISTSVVGIIGLLAGLLARRKPSQVAYELDDAGLRIGQKNYPYSLFKSFSITHDEALPSINLEPMKRFMPPVTIYFAGQDEEQITSALGAHLPYQDHKPDRIEQLSKRLRF